MRDLMDGKEEVLVGGGSDQIRGCNKAPGQHRGVAEQVRAAYLERDDAQDDIFGYRFGTAELGYLFDRVVRVGGRAWMDG